MCWIFDIGMALPWENLFATLGPSAPFYSKFVARQNQFLESTYSWTTPYCLADVGVFDMTRR
jgi:hypothetical protein